MLNYPRWKMIFVMILCVMGVIYSIPNFVSKEAQQSMSNWSTLLPGKTINFGLDLQGGSQLLLEVDINAVMKERMEATMDTLRKEFRRNAVGYVNMRILLRDNAKAISFGIRAGDDWTKVSKLIKQVDGDLSVSMSEGVAYLSYPDTFLKHHEDLVMDQSIEIVRRRVDETGTKEPSIQRQGKDRILLQLPGLENPDELKKLLGKTAKLKFQLVDLEASNEVMSTGKVPLGKTALPLQEDPNQNIVVEAPVIITGDMLVDAQPNLNEGRPVVSFRFDSIGAKRFGEATTANVGRPFAIILDDEVISYPRISQPILSGSGIITGSFTVQEAHDLALLLRSGSLPAPITVIEERTVGPGLGADSVKAGTLSGLVGCGLVIAFMLISYGFFGILANLALIFNIFFIIALLSAFQVTLTLPGIAGIILTIGMAVDANVLIYERIREELKLGAKPIASIEAGFSRALSAIIDGNLTTLIAAFLLAYFGSGPVRGFAVNLSVGIITSMFSAIMITRLLIVLWFSYRRPKTIHL
ncbi:MAG: protein translocase subunit SecD [Alphaproteobacteria bacterium]|nr:protein translocase subunit SecD [Alphaproteobacteria bacterium]MBP9877034.1 protein translocase subunit SecD [Alphaproteobacteria bacterium]